MADTLPTPPLQIDLATRRALVATTTLDGAPGSPPAVNGIDYIEVRNIVAADPTDDRSEITVQFVHPLIGSAAAPATPTPLGNDHVEIRGGDRVVDPAVESVVLSGSTLTVLVARIGDHSTYALCIDNAAGWLDPQLSTVPFTFLIDCPTRFDCAGLQHDPAPTPPSPHLDLLARDYHSLRRMMLDRLAVTVPSWIERNPADLGVAVVELLAYVGDRIAYDQDVVGTEAYLDRARFRTSVARHLRLVDYHLHDGHNARAWMVIDVIDQVTLGPRARFWTAVAGQPRVTSSFEVFEAAIAAGAEFFETVHESTHAPAHNEIAIHRWADTLDTLPAGSTSATLRDPFHTLSLTAGSYLLFEEQTASGTGMRQVVRLTDVNEGFDPLDRGGGSTGSRVLHITWAAADALTAALPLDGGRSVARGNLALVDHGRTERVPVRLGTVSERFAPTLPTLDVSSVATAFRSVSTTTDPTTVNDLDAGRVNNRLLAAIMRAGVELVAPGAVTTGADRWAVSDHQWLATVALSEGRLDIEVAPLSARGLTSTDPLLTRPAIALHDVDPATGTSGPWVGERPNRWEPVADLVRALSDDQVFVVETESDGVSTLRFGDDVNGRRPNVGDVLDATFRTGSGTAGNVGAGSIQHLLIEVGSNAGTLDTQTVFGSPNAIVGVRNPIGAVGGIDPETIVQARVRAPEVFTKQRRAVTPQDYAARLEAHPLVQRAATRRQWTGSWSTLFCTVDLVGGLPLDDATEQILRNWVEPWRTMGHDIEIDEPLLVAVEIEVCVGLHPPTSRLAVFTEIMERLGSGLRSDGTPSLFHPDRLSFGERIYLSTIYAECQAVPGVVEVDVRTFRRLGSNDPVAIERGYLELFGREIAVLANDPNRPERGSLTIDVQGGR